MIVCGAFGPAGCACATVQICSVKCAMQSAGRIEIGAIPLSAIAMDL